MKSFNYKSKYHYIVKYFVIAFPLIFIFIVSLIDTITYEDFFLSVTDIAYSLEISINKWYFDILSLLDLKSTFDNGGFIGFMVIYPLYVFWVYVFDLILDVFTIIPKLAHKFLNKLGGEKYE